MERRAGWRWGCALLAGLALAGLGVLSAPLFGALTPYSTTDEASKLERAASDWHAAPIAHYRLTVAINGFQPCQFVAEIRAEQVVGTPTVAPVGCSRSLAQPMTELYQTAIGFARNAANRCGANGCACDGPLGLRVTTDSASHALVRFSVRPRPEHAWRYRSIWNTLTGRQVCALIETEYPDIRLLAFEPLP